MSCWTLVLLQWLRGSTLGLRSDRAEAEAESPRGPAWAGPDVGQEGVVLSAESRQAALRRVLASCVGAQDWLNWSGWVWPHELFLTLEEVLRVLRPGCFPSSAFRARPSSRSSSSPQDLPRKSSCW